VDSGADCEGQGVAVEISGFCDERFLPLKDAFRANFEDCLEVGASFAVTHKGKPVVDLWAGYADWNKTRRWEKDTIVLIYSTTKIPLILSVLLLVDRGLVELDVPVATYWPEFAAGGKARVTVRDALTHRAGVPGFEPPVCLEALHDWDGITAHIAAEAHWFDGESVLCYHAITYGFVLGEIIRRVSGRKPSQFFREEIADKTGIDLQLGLLSLAERARLAQIGYLKPPGGMMTRNPLARRVTESVRQGDTTTWEHQRSDMPASNGYGNARAIARLCTIGAMGGCSTACVTFRARRSMRHPRSRFLRTSPMWVGFGWASASACTAMDFQRRLPPASTGVAMAAPSGSWIRQQVSVAATR